MAFPLPLVRFTARRAAGEELPVLYPRLMRDRSMLPKVAIAIEHFESLVGRERRELDTEMLVQFFGDHKLARCMMACLARTYRFRPPALEDVVTKRAAQRLRRKRLETPVALRLHLFDDVNARADGYLGSGERPEAMARLEGELGLRPGELDRLLLLDAPEHAVLTRVGAVPRPEDVVAHYNFGVLETLLRHAERIELTLTGAERETAGQIRRLCAGYGVEVSLRATGRALAVTLSGRQDAMGTWARHGRQAARAVIELLDRARDQVLDGSAIVALRDRRALLRLNAEALDVLSGAPDTAGGWDEDLSWDAELWPAAAQLLRATSARARRTAPGHGKRGAAPAATEGWRARRLPDPQAWAAGVVTPVLALSRGATTALVCPVRSARHASRLAPVAQAATTGEPLVFVGAARSLGPLQSAGALTVPVAAAEPASIAAALGRAFGAAPSLE